MMKKEEQRGLVCTLCHDTDEKNMHEHEKKGSMDSRYVPGM